MRRWVVSMKLTVHRQGDLKQEPFTVLVVANPALEAPLDTGQFRADPIMLDPAGFAAAASYIERAIFGQLAHQAEPLLGDPVIAPHVRFLSSFDANLPATAQYSFVGQDSSSTMIVARRRAIRDYLVANQLVADVVYAVSDSSSHTRASAWHTSDDDNGPGNLFVLDQVPLYHRQRYLIPGTVAIHKTATSLTAAHEFSHAISSYTNGKIVDLYVDVGPALNSKRPRPTPVTPSTFATYQQVPIPTGDRGAFGYPPSWSSYHCALSSANAKLPALMDNYWAASPPEVCENDVITRRFIRDRVLAKMGRP